MSPSRVRSQPSPRSAHRCWPKQMREHDALVDRLSLPVPDTWLRKALQDETPLAIALDAALDHLEALAGT